MPAIWQTWPRYSSTLPRWSARFMGSRRSTCLLIAIRCLASTWTGPLGKYRYTPLGSRLKRGFGRKTQRSYTGTRFARALRLVFRLRFRLDHRRERRDLLALAEAHHDHALRRATEALELLDGDADDRPAVGDQHHLVALAHHARARELALRLGEL